jgi:hypothetical protein
MIRFNELAQAAAGYMRRQQQITGNFRPLSLVQRRGQVRSGARTTSCG